VTPPKRKRRPNATANPYGADHQRRRRAWVPRVATGQVECMHCHRLILPDTPWDLSHPEDNKYARPLPAHAFCNRSYASAVTRAKRNGRPVVEVLGPTHSSREW
jgi:hypothetical protein